MNTLEQATDFVLDTVDKVADASHQAAENLEHKSEQLKHCEQRLLRNCQAYVRENPISSIGIAVAAGFLLSRLLNNR